MVALSTLAPPFRARAARPDPGERRRAGAEQGATASTKARTTVLPVSTGGRTGPSAVSWLRRPPPSWAWRSLTHGVHRARLGSGPCSSWGAPRRDAHAARALDPACPHAGARGSRPRRAPSGGAPSSGPAQHEARVLSCGVPRRDATQGRALGTCDVALGPGGSGGPGGPPGRRSAKPGRGAPARPRAGLTEPPDRRALSRPRRPKMVRTERFAR